MRMSIALPIAGALAIGLSSLSPAQTEAKTLAAASLNVPPAS
jgi:hypothetical protein